MFTSKSYISAIFAPRKTKLKGEVHSKCGTFVSFCQCKAGTSQGLVQWLLKRFDLPNSSKAYEIFSNKKIKKTLSPSWSNLSARQCMHDVKEFIWREVLNALVASLLLLVFSWACLFVQHNLALAYIAWLLSFSKMAALFSKFWCYFRQGFHKVWKHFASWHFGEWPIIVLAFCCWEEKKVSIFVWTSPSNVLQWWSQK